MGGRENGGDEEWRKGVMVERGNRGEEYSNGGEE